MLQKEERISSIKRNKRNKRNKRKETEEPHEHQQKITNLGKRTTH